MATPKSLKWTLAGLALALVVAAGGIFFWKGLSKAFLGDIAGAEAALGKERQSAREEGLPLESTELFTHRPIDPIKNAGPILAVESKAIYDEPAQKSLREALTEVRKGTDGTGTVESIRTGLASLGPHLDRILAVSERPICDFGKDYSEGFALLFPEFAQLKSVVHVLTAKAWLDARSGHAEEAAKALRAAFQMAHFAGQEPSLIGLLVQIANASIAHDMYRRLVLANGRSARELAAYRSVLSRFDPPVDFEHAFKGELVMGIATVRSISTLRDLEALSGESSEKTELPTLNVTSMRRAWEARLLQFWRRVFRGLRQHPGDYLAQRKVLLKEVADDERHRTVDYLLNRILFPVFGEAFLAAVRERAQAILSRATLALVEYRLQHREFPERLSDLRGSWIDPFDGRPLRYARAGDGFRLYSIDKDLEDNGGRKRDSRTPTDTPVDLVVESP